MPRYLPVALNLEGRPVLVVGAGAVGTQKVLDFLACGAVVTVVSPVASEAVRWEAASRFESPNFQAETERRLRVGEPAIDPADFPMLREALARGGKAGVARALPRSLIENTTATGTPEEVVERVQRYRRAGVTFPLIRPQAAHQVIRILDLFAKASG